MKFDYREFMTTTFLNILKFTVSLMKWPQRLTIDLVTSSTIRRKKLGLSNICDNFDIPLKGNILSKEIFVINTGLLFKPENTK